MKRCPTCNRIFIGEALNYCLDDGALLSNKPDSEATLVIPSAAGTMPPPNVIIPSQPSQSSASPYRWMLFASPLFLAVLMGGAAIAFLYELNKPASPTQAARPSETLANSNQSSTQTRGGGTPTTWEATAAALIGDVGKTFTVTCPAGGTPYSVWGSDIYTADSSICTAAVHSGLLTFEGGGTVTIELRPGRPVYGATERNDVTTSAYGEYNRSFVFKTGTNPSGEKEAQDVTSILWSTPASILAYEAGKTYEFRCPAGGTENNIWGTDFYTADSSICTAAVHAGLTTFERGGLVRIELRPGQSTYQGTSRNGVKSNEFSAYPHSFVVK